MEKKIQVKIEVPGHFNIEWSGEKSVDDFMEVLNYLEIAFDVEVHGIKVMNSEYSQKERELMTEYPAYMPTAFQQSQ